MKIYLSPSDQRTNKCSGGDTEAAHCKKIADSAAKYLKKSGYTVKVGDNSKEGSYPARVTESNNWGADLHIPIHTNAGGGQGTEVYAYPSSKDNKYVKAVYNVIAKASIGSDRGIKTTTSLYEVTNSKAVCIYIECEFHDTNGSWIDKNVNVLGKAIAEGICTADGKKLVTGTTSSSSTATNTDTLYRVQTGAFSKQSNAEAQVKELKADGFSAYAYYDSSDKLYHVQVGAYSEKANADAQVSKLKKAGYTTIIK